MYSGLIFNMAVVYTIYMLRADDMFVLLLIDF